MKEQPTTYRRPDDDQARASRQSMVLANALEAQQDMPEDPAKAAGPVDGTARSAEGARAVDGATRSAETVDAADGIVEGVPQAGSSDAEGAQTTAIVPTFTQKATPTVIVCYASVGSGHRSAAIAIAEAFERIKQQGGRGLFPPDTQIELVDILQYGRTSIDGDKTASMFTGATRPFYDITWRYVFTGTHLWGGGSVWSHVMFKPFTDYVEKVKPLAIVATHIVSANAAAAARMLTGQAFPLVCVPTDYEVEGLWPHKECDLFCVATESMAETLRPRLVPESRIALTGIPVRGHAEAHFDRDAVREQYHLPTDKLVALVLVGAHLAQPYVRMRETMDEAMPYLKGLDGFHFVFIAGRDKDYEAHLKAEQSDMAIDNMTVLGYVDGMQALMNAADLAICKSGGLTVTECLCERLPMLLLGRAYGQEKVNTAMLTSMGVGMHATTARELLSSLRHLQAKPEALEAMLVNGEVLRRPHAADDVANRTIDLIGTTKPVKCNFVRFYKGGKPAHIR